MKSSGLNTRCVQRLEYKVRASDVGNESEKQRAEFLSQNS
jgi:hypothetical protein